MIRSFKKLLKKGYWTQGSIWEFDWYIDVFFAEVMAYGNYPINLGYKQAILGDQFLNPTNEKSVINKFLNFFRNSKEVKELLDNQAQILESADVLIKQLENKYFNPKSYETAQKDLSLLMASVSVVFDTLIVREIQKMSFKEKIREQELVAYLVDNSSHTKLNESNNSLLNIYNQYKNNLETNRFNYSKLSSQTKKIIRKHTQIYGWLNTGERGGKPWKETDFLTQLSTLVNKSKPSKNTYHPF